MLTAEQKFSVHSFFVKTWTCPGSRKLMGSSRREVENETGGVKGAVGQLL